LPPTSFHDRCQALFGERLGHGRRWKSAAASLLGIGRASLYRYFDEDSTLPAAVLATLEQFEAPAAPARDDREMVVLAATAVVDVQRSLDAKGWLSSPYPPSLRRFLDLASAYNISLDRAVWPTDLHGFMRSAQEPLVQWVPDMGWDLEGEYFAARLVLNGEVSTECLRLAVPGGDPERELEENRGFEMLIGLCRDRGDGEDIYRAWRRTVIAQPLLTNWSATILTDPYLAGVERIDEIIEAFFDRAPESLALHGELPICTVSGTVLRRDGRGFHTECRDPEAIRRARAGTHDTVRYRPGMLYLKRAFRTFWLLPGLTELDLATRLAARGWATTLWPQLDRVDLIAVSSDGQRRVAIDVKDYFSPARLAARFAGFKAYEADHACYLVIPDYLLASEPRFAARFEAMRASSGKTPVALRTASDLIEELGAG
jgi:hypothetical protein